MLAAGLISALGMAPTFYWPLMIAGLSVFYAVYARTETVRTAALYGFLFAFGYHLLGLWWIGNALLVEGNEFAWVWPLSVIGLPTLLGLFSAVFTALARKFSNPLSLSGFAALVVMLALGEWVRGHLFTGFPWNVYGQNWTSVLPILQAVSVIGMYGLSLLTLFWFCAPGFLFVSRLSGRRKAILGAVVAVSFLAVYGFGALRLNANPTQYSPDTSVRVVQPNVTQALKWKPDMLWDHFQSLISLSQPYPNSSTGKDHKTYIIWPETSVPPALLNRPELHTTIQDTLTAFPHDTYLMLGTLRFEMDESEKRRYYNSLFVIDKNDDVVAHYDKSHLVPFGEYIPFQNLLPLTPVTQFNGFAHGPGSQTITLPNRDKFTPLICYEIIFPFMAKGGAERSDFIVTITNDGWYGESAGPYQHFNQAIIRATEQGIPVVRAANTGVSGVIDAYGRIVTKTSLVQKTAQTTPLPLPSGKITLYSKTDDWIFLVFVFISIIALFLIHKNENVN